MHTLMPGMVLRDGHPHMAVGTMGGDAQPQIHVQLLMAMLDFRPESSTGHLSSTLAQRTRVPGEARAEHATRPEWRR